MPKYGIIVGDPLMAAVSKVLPQATGHAVDYPAGILPDSPLQGGNATVKHIRAQAAACPDQKFVLVGYSQGGSVMHLAANALPPELYPRIVALVMFGDPGNKKDPKGPFGEPVQPFPKELQEKTKENCANMDMVSTPSGRVV